MAGVLPVDAVNHVMQQARGALNYGLIIGTLGKYADGTNTALVSATTAWPATTTALRKIKFDSTIFPANGSGKRPIGVLIKSAQILTYSGGAYNDPVKTPVASTHGVATIAVSDEYALILVDFVDSGEDQGFHAGWIASADVDSPEFSILYI